MATSPPAYSHFTEVRPVAKSVFTVPPRPVSAPSTPCSSPRSPSWPTASSTVSHGIVSSVPSSSTGANLPCSSNTRDARRTTTPVTFPPSPAKATGPTPLRRTIDSSSPSRISTSDAGICSSDSRHIRVTDVVPGRRTAVRAQSYATSPPPITTTRPSGAPLTPSLNSRRCLSPGTIPARSLPGRGSTRDFHSPAPTNTAS